MPRDVMRASTADEFCAATIPSPAGWMF